MEKIIKLMIQELGNMPKAKVGLAEADENDEWEDDYTGTAIGGGTLRSAFEEEDTREVDSETYGIVLNWFKYISADNVGDFYAIFNRLTPSEKNILEEHAK
jgi:hypothetical protein